MEFLALTFFTISKAVFTLIKSEEIIGGITGNRADALFCKGMSHVWEKLKKGDSKTNHDLQKSIRKAQLESIIGICGVILKEKGFSSENIFQVFWKNSLNIFSSRDTEETWLINVCKDLMKEVKDISKSQYSPPSSNIDSQIELLLISQNESVEKRLADLKSELLETILIEIHLRYPHPPKRFIDLLKNGWEEIDSEGKVIKVDWFNGLCKSFAFELKHNQVIANIYQSQILANLSAKYLEKTNNFQTSGLETYYQTYEALGDIFSQNLVQLENQLLNFQQQNKEIFNQIIDQRKTEVNELLLLFSMLPDINKQQEALGNLFVGELLKVKEIVIDQGKRNEEISLFVGKQTQEFIKSELSNTKDSIINAIKNKTSDSEKSSQNIVILYKRNAHPDEEIVSFLTESLNSIGHNVFVDKHITPGIEWAKEIENQIGTADAIICLLSESAINSEMLAYEIQIAHEESQTNNGVPYLVPVRIKYEDELPSSISCYLDQIQYALWNDISDNSRLLNDISKALLVPENKKPRKITFETTGGAVPIHSNFYIVRKTDKELLSAIERKDSIILTKGSRQVGKTSLLARGLKLARESNRKVVVTDFQQLNSSHLDTIESFYMTLGYNIADQLEIETYPDEVWVERRSPSINFERYLRREIMGKITTPIVWGLDEVDKLFSCSYGSEVFGFFRSLYNARALNPDSPWSNLTMIIVYATEAHLFITDINQSPFNVGTKLVLDDFSFEQVSELNRRHGKPLRTEKDLEKFISLVGGQPYLVRRGLYEIASQSLQIDFFESSCTKEDGPFGDHLRRFLVMLSPNEELCRAITEVLKGHSCPTQETFYKLRSAGLLTGESAQTAKLRCSIYDKYLRRHLL